MRIRVLTIALLAAALLAVGESRAQQAPAQPNPLDVVPDKMPFDIPYGAAISARAGERRHRARPRPRPSKHDWKLNIAVVDSGGNLVAFERMDGAQLASIQISEHKARAAVDVSPRDQGASRTASRGGFNYLLSLDGIIGSRGGIPLVDGGKLIGAIGCSGGTGSQDEVAAKAGAGVVNK